MDDRGGKDFTLGLIGADLGRYERPLPALLTSFAGLLGEDFLDAGANTGLYSLHYARVAPRAKVHAFEPLTHLADALEENVRLNRDMIGRISVVRLGLSDRDGTSTFYETINDRGFLSTSSTLEKSHLATIKAAYRERSIKTVRLDNYIAESGARFGIIKLDVEGHELAALRGAEQTIETQRPIILIEVLKPADFAGLNDFVTRNQYVPFLALDQAVCPSAEVRFVDGSLNQIFCPIERQYQLAKVAVRAGLQLG
jgi:FkbM family methyltransferase